ncbi:undecaprenyl/decaprenyl-phosphate alpha-N-acetylglucosaminyl 1-phosphate transferase [Rhodocaloribacter litoris]|uniref:glycosyltransferase family 4 protein n=1 Tax=Rhodocaloribacter litoris TaxID=2558931 RepID=UPI001420F206|nr:MraY family glycosyltransferase [Rhodocaloribacter litoris]QXD16162.1 undecaprenyl/decaprenyl-phosphate alpha-N-acetylglucosaminyl 1-phosphate transferase [Rhodocaloribacter litoris]
MEYLFLLGIFALVLGATLLLTLVVRWLAIRKGWVDVPDGERKLHARPVPSLGGVGIAFGYVVGIALLYFSEDYLSFRWEPVSPLLWGGALVMLVTGIIDDIRGLSFRHKFAVQVLVAYALICGGYRIDVSGLPFMGDDPAQHMLLSIPLTLLWFVGVMNAINLIDGLDGLAAGVSIIAFAYLGLIFSFHGGPAIVLPALVMVGGLAGFLFYNFNPARIFMGDSGSLFLGFMLAAYSLEGQAHLDPLLSFLTLVAVMGLPLLDAGFAIIRRLLSGRALFAPDNDHIHHRMVRRWPQRQAVLLLYAVATCFGTIAVFMSVASPTTGFLLFGLALSLSFVGLNRLKVYRQPYTRPEIQSRFAVSETKASSHWEANLRHEAEKIESGDERKAVAERYESVS